MRRALIAALLAVSSFGVFLSPVGANTTTTDPNQIMLSYDFSDNTAPASASGGGFNIIVDVLPERTGGVVRMVAVPPSGAGVSNLVCKFQPVQKNHMECDFNFTSGGTWLIHAQYATGKGSDVSASALTNINVGF